jgi:hypothetical protein
VTEDKPAGETEAAETRPNALKNLRHRREYDALLFALIVVAIIGSALALTFASDLGSLFSSRYSESRAVAANAVVVRIAAAFIIIATLGLITFLYAAGSPIFRSAKLSASSGGVYDDRILEAA